MCGGTWLTDRARSPYLAEGGMMATERGPALARATRSILAAAVLAALLAAGYFANAAPGPTPGRGDAAAVPRADARVDRFGDPLPVGTLARLGTLRFQHRSPVQSLCYSPDGKLLASVGTDKKTARIWEVATGREVRHFDAAGASAAFSPDGKSLITSGQKTCVRDVASGEVTFTFPVACEVLALSRDGVTLALAAVDGVHLWDLATRKERRYVYGPAGLQIAFSPDGSRVAVGDKHDVHVYAAATGEETALLSDVEPSSLSFSADGKTLATATPAAGLGIADVASGRELVRLRPERFRNGLVAAFSPDGKLLAVAEDRAVTLWDVSTRRKLRPCRLLPDEFRSLAFAPDGKTLAAAGLYGRIQICEVAAGQLRMPFTQPPPAGSRVVFRADGKSLLTANGPNDPFEEDEACEWDAATGKELHRLDCPGAIEPLANGTLVAVDVPRSDARLLKVSTGEKVGELPGCRAGDVRAFSADGKRGAIANWETGTVRVWDVAAGKELQSIRCGHRHLPHIALSPDGSVLATYSVQPAAVPPAGAGEMLEAWDVASGRQSWREPDVTVTAIAFSPDGTQIATVGPSPDLPDAGGIVGVRLWDAATGRHIPVGKQHKHPVYLLAFSPDGRMLLTRDDGLDLCLWEAATGQLRQVLRADGEGVWSASFSPDGRRLATARSDRTVLVRDLTIAAARLSETAAAAEWEALASPDGGRAYTAVHRLAGDPGQAVPLLRGRLRAAAARDPERLAKLIAGLDSDRYDARQEAQKALAELGDTAVPALRAALRAKPSVEAARRIQEILDGIGGWSADQLQAWRAVEVLERIDTAEARQVLQEVADSQAGPRLVEGAGNSLRRLARLSARP